MEDGQPSWLQSEFDLVGWLRDCCKLENVEVKNLASVFRKGKLDRTPELLSTLPESEIMQLSSNIGIRQRLRCGIESLRRLLEAKKDERAVDRSGGGSSSSSDTHGEWKELLGVVMKRMDVMQRLLECQTGRKERGATLGVPQTIPRHCPNCHQPVKKSADGKRHECIEPVQHDARDCPALTQAKQEQFHPDLKVARLNAKKREREELKQKEEEKKKQQRQLEPRIASIPGWVEFKQLRMAQLAAEYPDRYSDRPADRDKYLSAGIRVAQEYPSLKEEMTRRRKGLDGLEEEMLAVTEAEGDVRGEEQGEHPALKTNKLDEQANDDGMMVAGTSQSNEDITDQNEIPQGDVAV